MTTTEMNQISQNEPCCDSPDIITERGESFCKNCGLVTESRVVKLNNNKITIDGVIEKRLAQKFSLDMSRNLAVKPEVPYNILTHFNRKYGINVYNFSLPRVTCVGKTPLCDKMCYGNTYAFCYPHVKNRYKQNLSMTFRSKFVFLVVNQINRLKIEHIRIHTIGDFYNQEYFNKWCEIARQCPNVKILAYTRNWKIDASKRPSNFTLYYSVDSSTTQFNPTIPLQAIMFKPPEDVRSYIHLKVIDGTRVCSSRCHFCKFCWAGKENISFPIAKGKKTYKPKGMHTPYQLSEDWKGEPSMRPRKKRDRKLTPENFDQTLIDELKKRPRVRDELVTIVAAPRTTIFDHIKHLIEKGIVYTEPLRKEYEIGKEMRGRPQTLFKVKEESILCAQ